MNDPVTLDMRVIAAVKSDLAVAVTAGTFRADLLYRLNVVTIDVPPFSAQPDDIPALFLNLTSQGAVRYTKPMPDVSATVLSHLALALSPLRPTLKSIQKFLVLTVWLEASAVWIAGKHFLQ